MSQEQSLIYFIDRKNTDAEKIKKSDECFDSD